MAIFHSRSKKLELLSQLALAQHVQEPGLRLLSRTGETGKEERSEFYRLSYDHHVVIRALQPLQQQAFASGYSELGDWTENMLSTERARIANALEFLSAICRELEDAGCPTIVMKSLDHWPDLGNDLDLYTAADKRSTAKVMLKKFHATASLRTWGDRLADKCSYRVPGLRPSVEIHHGRLGQTGEHRRVARRFLSRRVTVQLDGYSFSVPAAEERVIAATLQRLYRHFYMRICDVANTCALLDTGELDFAELHAAANSGGIWTGVATYLRLVSDYIERYRGRGLRLPQYVSRASAFGGDVLFVRGPWLRVPLFPGAAQLYIRQMAQMAAQGDIPGTLRLSLLPPLASAARVAYRLTGDHRGIW